MNEARECWPSTMFSALNDDILMRIFDYINFDDKIRLRRTCRRWRCLLERHMSQMKSLRIGYFYSGGYNTISGLQMNVPCEHTRSPKTMSLLRQTGSLFNHSVLHIPAELETNCYEVNRYDYLHRAMKQCHSTLTTLSLGRINISYRLLMVITHNLDNLEHLELISCASAFTDTRFETLSRQHSIKRAKAILSDSNPSRRPLPGLESFNSRPIASIHTSLRYNQHDDEEVNVRERFARANLIRNCELLRETKRSNQWPKLKHLLVRNCNLLNEFSLSLILALTKRTLTHLVIESNQYFSGEFLNYCGPKLTVLRVRFCPAIQVKFLEDLVKLRQILSQQQQQDYDDTHVHSRCTSKSDNMHASTSSLSSNISDCSTSSFSETSRASRTSHDYIPPPIDKSMFANLTRLNQEIYCTL